jgi:WD40 repeat protein
MPSPLTARRWCEDPGQYDNSDVKVFDLPSPTPRLDFKETGVYVAAISPDGKLLALPSHRWGVKGSTRLSRVVVSAYAALGFTLNGFSQSLEVHAVRLYNADTGRFLRALPLRKARANPLVQFSSDSRTVVVRYFAPTHVNSTDRPMNDWSVKLWDVPAGLTDGGSSFAWFTVAAAALVLAGAAVDWRRAG